jgi:hypothetical protein
MVKTGTDLPFLTQAIEDMKMWHACIGARIKYLTPCFNELLIRQIDRYVARLSIIFAKCLDQARSMVGEMSINTDVYKSFVGT